MPKKNTQKNWTEEEEQQLLIDKENGMKGKELEDKYKTSAGACSNKFRSIVKNGGVSKKAKKEKVWSEERNEQLLKSCNEKKDDWLFIGEKLNCTPIAAKTQLTRVVKDSKLKLEDFRKPTRIQFTLEEDIQLLQLVEKTNKDWKVIAESFSGMSETACTKRYYKIKRNDSKLLDINNQVEELFNNQVTPSSTNMSLMTFLNLEDSRFEGVLIDNDMSDETKFHYSKMRKDTSFLVRNPFNGELLKMSISEMAKSKVKYEVFSVEEGFIVPEIKSIMMKKKDLVKIGASIYKESFVFDKQARIVEEEVFYDNTECIKLSKNETTCIRSIPDFQKSDYKKDFFIINNHQLFTKDRIVRTSLPIGRLNDDSVTTSIYYDILNKYFPNISDENIGIMHQLLGAYLADGSGSDFRLYFNGSNERQISNYFIAFLKEICQYNPKDITEEILFRKAVHDGVITIRIPMNEENELLIEKVKEKGYHESVSMVKALASTKLLSFLKEIKIIGKFEKQHSEKCFSECYNITNFNLWNSYKFFEGSVQGDGCVDQAIRFTQKCETQVHHQYFNQVWHCANICGFRSNICESNDHVKTLTMTGKNISIFESHGLDKKKVKEDSNYNQFIFNITTLATNGNDNDNEEMYYFEKKNTTFQMSNGILLQNCDKDLVNVRQFHGYNRWTISKVDNYKQGVIYCIKNLISAVGTFKDLETTKKAVRNWFTIIEGLKSSKNRNNKEDQIFIEELIFSRNSNKEEQEKVPKPKDSNQQKKRKDMINEQDKNKKQKK